ncbi:amidohydrolase family protein [Paenarthrobacter nicotinovorans]|uniref:amidohydrolase family protein n=1 Tax=Paenarthrobacter nicotinovorans TaxID=29320 RepID=UPI00374892E5
MNGVPLETVDLLLVGADSVITMDSRRRLLSGAALAVNEGRIVAVDDESVVLGRYTARRTINCVGKVVVPGLIDAHGHAGHSMIKTLGSDTPSLWMRVVTPFYFHWTTPEYWHLDGLLSSLERLRMGVTCGVSVMGSRPRSDDPSISQEHARAYAEIGIRDIISVGPAGLPLPHPATRYQGTARAYSESSLDALMAGTESVINSCHGANNGRTRVFLTPFTIVPSLNPSAPSTPDAATHLTADDINQSRAIRIMAEKHRVRIHSDAFAGMIRLAAQDEYGLLGPDVHLQHCFGISPEEVNILAKTGTHVGHAPTGPAPVPHMLAAGINVAITTDGNSPRRPFDLLQAARSVQQAHQQSNSDEYLLPPGKLLEMITIDAAAALGMEDEIGSIEVGKKADIAVFDFKQAHLTPNWMVVHRLMYEAVGKDVDTVIVDGAVVLDNGVLPSIDEELVLAEAGRVAHDAVKRSGLENHLTEPGWGEIRRQFSTPIDLPTP